LICARNKHFSIRKCELKPTEHACKIFFNYLKLYAVSFFAKKVHYIPQTRFSNEFSQHYWQEYIFNQSRFDAYVGGVHSPSLLTNRHHSSPICRQIVISLGAIQKLRNAQRVDGYDCFCYELLQKFREVWGHSSFVCNSFFNMYLILQVHQD